MRRVGEGRWLQYEVGAPVASHGKNLTSIVVVPPNATDDDLLTVVHADVTDRCGRVSEAPTTAVVTDQQGNEWLGFAWIEPVVAEIITRAVPGAVMLWWDDGHDLLVPGGAGPQRTKR